MSTPVTHKRATSTSPLAILTLVSVNVGMPKVIGQSHGKPVLSGIAKSPVGDVTLDVTTTNLAGDRQADKGACPEDQG